MVAVKVQHERKNSFFFQGGGEGGKGKEEREGESEWREFER